MSKTFYVIESSNGALARQHGSYGLVMLFTSERDAEKVALQIYGGWYRWNQFQQMGHSIRAVKLEPVNEQRIGDN